MKDDKIDQESSERSAFATICFKREDEVLQAIEESLNANKWQSETLIYDGIPVYHRPGLSIDLAMRDTEAYVLKKTDMHIELAEKPMFQENLSVQDVLEAIKQK